MKKAIWAAALLTIQMLVLGENSFAVGDRPNPLSSDVVKAEIVKTEIASSQQKLELKEQQARQIVSNLFKVQMKMRTVVRKKSSLVHEKFNLERNVDKIQETIRLKEDLVAEQKIYLKKRVRALLSLKGQSFMQAIFSAQSPNKIGLNLRILGALAMKDQRTLKEYTVSVKQIRDQQKDLTRRLSQIQVVEKSLTQQEVLFLGEQVKRRSILNEIHQEKKQTLAKIEELRQSTRNSRMDDSGVLDLLYRPSFLDQKGKLAWPVPGSLRTAFGRGAGQEHSRRLFSKGIFLATSPGTSVKAVFDGKVVFSGEISGLGSTLVLDHGDHFYTVYSHVEQPVVKVESRVQTNQKIALAGEDRVESRAGVYFEVRHFSEPSDPKTWMKGIL